MNTHTDVIVAIKHAGVSWDAFEVRITSKRDIYINGQQKAHISYHASGQRHYKVGRDYVQWSEGTDMKFERPQPETVEGREQIAGFLRFDIARLEVTRTPLTKAADIIIDASDFEPLSILAFAVSVVGQSLLSKLAQESDWAG